MDIKQIYKFKINLVQLKFEKKSFFCKLFLIIILLEYL